MQDREVFSSFVRVLFMVLARRGTNSDAYIAALIDENIITGMALSIRDEINRSQVY